MIMEKRNRYTSEFKAKVVLELLREESTLTQVASKYQLNPQMRPYLLRGLKITHPDQVWAVDVTYIRMRQGFMYLFAIIDLYRYIIDYEISMNLDRQMVLNCLKPALPGNN
jgi:transposase InsO family protein